MSLTRYLEKSVRCVGELGEVTGPLWVEFEVQPLRREKPGKQKLRYKYAKKMHAWLQYMYTRTGNREYHLLG